MVASGQVINNYMRDVIKDDEVFVLLELKHCGDTWLNYNYYVKGDNRKVLMSLGQIIEKEAQEMGISFDQAIEVLKAMHGIDEGRLTRKTKKRIESEWTGMRI